MNIHQAKGKTICFLYSLSIGRIQKTLVANKENRIMNNYKMEDIAEYVIAGRGQEWSVELEAETINELKKDPERCNKLQSILQDTNNVQGERHRAKNFVKTGNPIAKIRAGMLGIRGFEETNKEQSQTPKQHQVTSIHQGDARQKIAAALEAQKIEENIYG